MASPLSVRGGGGGVSVRGVLLLWIVLHATFAALLVVWPARFVSAYTGLPLPQLSALTDNSSAGSITAAAAAVGGAGSGTTAGLVVLLLSIRCWWSCALACVCIGLVPVWYSPDTRLVSRVVAWGVLPATFLQLIAQLYAYQTLNPLFAAGSNPVSNSGIAFVSGLLCILIVLAVTALLQPVSPLQLVVEAEIEHDRLQRRIAALHRLVLRSVSPDVVAAANAASANSGDADADSTESPTAAAAAAGDSEEVAAAATEAPASPSKRKGKSKSKK